MVALRGVRRRAIVLALAATLAACATAPRVDVTTAAAAPADVPFEMSGRLSARHGETGVTAGFRWHHAPGTDELVLSTPFGQALARLSGNADGVVLERQDGGASRSGDWESLTREALGVPVPVHGLAWWVRGTPHPASAHVVERDTGGRATVLRQDGWEIVYGYRDDGAQPTRLVLVYPGIEVRLAVDSRVDGGPR